MPTRMVQHGPTTSTMDPSGVSTMEPSGARSARLHISTVTELFHHWMNPIMATRGALDVRTLPSLPVEDSASDLLARMTPLWESRRAGASGDGRTLRRAVVSLLSPRFYLIGLWQLVDACCNFSQPLVIAVIIRDLRLGQFDNLGWSFALVGLLTIGTLGGAISIQQVLWGGARLGMRAKIALSAAIYAKTLHLGNAALLTTSAGAATNLVAIDVNRLEMSFTFFHMLWYAPTCVCILGVLLYWLVGVATFTGLGFLVFLFFVQRYVGSKIAGLRSHIAKQTDRRVKLMHDVLAGSEALKVNAWEDALASRVQQLRAGEESLIWRSLAMLSSLEALIFFAPGVATFLVLITRYALDRANGAAGLEIEEAYSVLGLCNVLVKQFNTFPRAVKSFDEAHVSFRRVERFLLLPEATGSREQQQLQQHKEQYKEGAASLKEPPQRTAETSPAALDAFGELAAGEVLRVEHAIATWTQAAAPPATVTTTTTADSSKAAEAVFTLRDFSMRVAAGQLCVLMGEVGCGKSSVLQLLLGEMVVRSGSVAVRRDGGVGYVPQMTWVVNASVRENILVGRELDQAWYDEVVSCCALETDLSSFGYGDATEIGERGVTVSGGQKARISLARALYGKPALLLLDDPLSAVDMHVAHHLVHEALLAVARRKLGSAVVLASHQLQYVHDLADVALVLEHGNVVAQGTPAEIAAIGWLAVSHAPVAEAAAAPEKAGERRELAPSEAADAQAAGKESGGTLVNAEPQSKTAPAGAAPTTRAGAATAASVSEMGRANKPSEARRFYLSQLGCLGCTSILCTFLGLAVCRALADWSLGRWIMRGQPTEGAVLYASLTGGTVLLGIGYALSFTRVIGAASRIHAAVLGRVLRAPKAFYDTSPLGLLLNVFSKDMDTLDELLPIALAGFLKCLTIVSTAVLVSAIAAPAALAIMPLVLLIFRWLTGYFQLTANQLKRLDKASAGPLFSLYSETLQGVTSIRAFGLQRQFKAVLLERLEHNHTAHFLWTASNRWFAARLDALTCLITFSVALSVLIFREHLEPSIAALALTYVIQTTSLFQWGFRMWAEVKNHFVSVERALTYTKLPQEPPAVCAGDAALLGRGWPDGGALTFTVVQMAYRPGLPLVLEDVSFELFGGVKAAIVGRSGAGKSSLSVALLRLAPLAAGSIRLDGVDIGTLGLRTLRRAITFIQQDAVLFAGTLRSNIDPFGEHTDAALDTALAEVDWPRLSGSTEGVRHEVAEGGANLSSGTRQLVLLARALLRGSRLLLLDEATANVDFATDAVIQRVVRSRFPRATILTIAHRLDTIIDYDTLLLMDAGRVAEHGKPSELLERPGSMFSGLVGSGPQAERLRAAVAAKGQALNR